MSEATPCQEADAGDDAEFDAWLSSAGAVMHERIVGALDLDTRCAEIFFPTVQTEGSSPREADVGYGGHLEVALREAAQSLEHWLALKAPMALTFQLEKAITTTHTMAVVGRSLLPESMSHQWALASDFLGHCHEGLTLLRSGIVHRTLARTEALGLLKEADQDIRRFRSSLEQFLHLAPSDKAHQVGSRLLATAEMLTLLLGWAHSGIVYLFSDCDSPVPVA